MQIDATVCTSVLKHLFQLELYRLLHEGNVEKLHLYADKTRDWAAPGWITLLALDAALKRDGPVVSTRTSMGSLSTLLTAFVEYGRQIRGIARLREIASKEEFQRLFALSPGTEQQANSDQSPTLESTSHVYVLPKSLIYTDVNDTSTHQHAVAEPVLVTSHRASECIQQRLLLLLNESLHNLHVQLKELGILHICVPHAVSGRCGQRTDNESCGRLHFQSRQESLEEFNERIRAHLLIISALNFFAAVEGRDARAEDSTRGFFQR